MKHGEAKQILEQVFNQENFNEDNFKNFIHNLFAKEITLKAENINIESKYSNHIASCKIIINNFTPDNNKNQTLIALIVRLKDGKNLASRNIQRDFIANILSAHHANFALVAFVAGNQANWRFSLVKLDYVLTESYQVEKQLSSAKRYSFLLGENEGSHTVKSRFLPILELGAAPTIAEIEKAFNIEIVTKNFFEQYKELFLTVKEQIEQILSNNQDLAQYFDNKQIHPADFAKKTLGQIVFLYFLQKKGWFGVKQNQPWGSGDKNFLRGYFEKNHQSKNFFKQCLEPLFYEALAVDRNDKNAVYEKIDNLRFPFLNGGLFEPIKGYNWEANNINLPNQIFSNNNSTKEGDIGNGILDIFDRYNFTVNENEPLEQEVAVDPEMLGKVFENLLEIKDRKSKGAFYTPREIVHYMCQETLINYLQNHSNLPIEQLTNFIKNKSLENIKNSASKIDLLLENVKICDPAVGSGAFMLGMLNEIVNARLTLAKINNNNLGEYHLKLNTIENSLYGVDIEASAVDIAKLRLWLALVVEEEEPSPLPNLDYKIMQGNSLLEEYEGIKLFDSNLFINQDKVKDLNDRITILNKELVNLGRENIQKSKNPNYLQKDKELKQLLKELQELSKQSFDKNSVSMLDLQDNQLQQQNKLNDLFAELQQLIKDYFSQNDKAKKTQLKGQINQLKYRLIEATLTSQNKQDKILEIQKLQQANSQPFFLWQLEFSDVFSGENAGFDIVIGNPPYIGEKGNKETIRQIAEGNLKQYYQGKMNIFYFFFHLALIIGKSKSITAFITTNYYITATGGLTLRKDLKENATILNLINFNELKIFESAKGQHNLITIFQKGLNKNIKAKTIQTRRNGNADERILNEIMAGKDPQTSYFTINQNNLYDGEEGYLRLGGIGNFESGIENILEKVRGGELLGTICNVNVGLYTGSDTVTQKHKEKYFVEDKKNSGIFIVSKEEKKNLNLNEKERKLILPLYKNSDIYKFGAKINNDLFLINFSFPNNKDISLSEVPNLYNHILKFEKILKGRKSNDNGLQIWLQKGYWWGFTIRKLNFDQAKIICPQRSKMNTFGYNETPWYASADVYFITQKKSQNDNIVELKYILALLNSKLYYHWFYHKGKRKGEMLELYQKPLSEVPIKIISKTDQAPFIAIVDEILAITNKPDYNPSFPPARQKELEAQIDDMVCNLYQLDEEEKRVVLGG